jgi:hypothetical protein
MDKPQTAHLLHVRLCVRGSPGTLIPDILAVKPKVSQSTDSMICGPWYIYLILLVLTWDGRLHSARQDHRCHPYSRRLRGYSLASALPLVSPDTVIDTALMFFLARMSTNCYLRSFNGVTRTTIPCFTKRRSIQYVKDFPGPVAAMVITSSYSSILRTTSICHRHGHAPSFSSTCLHHSQAWCALKALVIEA